MANPPFLFLFSSFPTQDPQNLCRIRQKELQNRRRDLGYTFRKHWKDHSTLTLQPSMMRLLQRTNVLVATVSSEDGSQ